MDEKCDGRFREPADQAAGGARCAADEVFASPTLAVPWTKVQNIIGATRIRPKRMKRSPKIAIERP